MTMMFLRTLTKPANDLSVLLTEQQEFLPMEVTVICLWAQCQLPEPLHYVGHMASGPQVFKLVRDSAHRAVAHSLFMFPGLVVCSDTWFTESVATVSAHRFCHELQADGAGHLLLDTV